MRNKIYFKDSTNDSYFVKPSINMRLYVVASYTHYACIVVEGKCLGLSLHPDIWRRRRSIRRRKKEEQIDKAKKSKKIERREKIKWKTA